MPTVIIPTPLRDVTGDVTEIEVEARTVGEVIDRLEELYPGIGERLRVDDEIRPGLAVAIDGAMSSRGLTRKLQPESEVHFLPAIGGG
ncbi:MAG: MoaD/ThiS family protein [Planctomycetaceae bacterium]|nr:MoaD/ThiS family protein [Planctomycetaceae bacterium]